MKAELCTMGGFRGGRARAVVGRVIKRRARAYETPPGGIPSFYWVTPPSGYYHNTQSWRGNTDLTRQDRVLCQSDLVLCY